MVILILTAMKNIFFILLFMINSCSRTHDEANDDKLLLSKTNYSGSELRTDGYYYMIYEFEPNRRTSPTFFYNNGVYLTFGCNNDNELEVCINETISKGWNFKEGWGLFKIESNKLYYERWYPKSFGSVFKVFSHECEIINNTTYIVKKKYRIVNGEQTEVTFPNYTYKFVEFANKPSSDNNFIP